jgi:hypothetical protein
MRLDPILPDPATVAIQHPHSVLRQRRSAGGGALNPLEGLPIIAGQAAPIGT